MIQVAIVEDEVTQTKLLQTYLQRYSKESGEVIKVITFSDGDEIVESYKSQFDIILMDVEMRFMDGMTAAEEIRKIDQEVIIIFITNMVQYAIRGYSVDALDYVLKPISYFALTQRLDRAIDRMKKRMEQYITINMKNNIQKLAVSQIYRIESQGHTLTYHTKQGNYESTTSSIKEMEEHLDGMHFFRCNKGCLVNLEHVKGIEERCAIVNGEKVAISRARKTEFLRELTDYVGEVIK